MGKTKSFSHIAAQDALEQLNNSLPSGEELVYHLLRIFCGYGDGNIRRIRDGVGNKSKDGRTTLIPNLIAYRPKGELDFHEEIKSMKSDPKITKQSPRLYVVSDGEMIVADDPKEQDLYENKVALMWKDFDFFYPLAGIEKFRNIEEAEADVKSAELMAKLFDEIRRHNDIKDQTQMHNLNIFMSRLLFCFFAEDTQLFPEENLFTNSIRQHTAEDGHDLAEFIDRAFLVMSTKDRTTLDILPKVYSVFPYVNGGLFEQQLPIPVLSRRARVLILKCGDYAWSDINPDIFGSMIQAVVSPEMRAGLGVHYTSVPNITKLIRPLFLDELHEEYQKAVGERSVKKLYNLLDRLSKIKFFDPACGSGNFLIISYKRVRELEIMIWQSIADISGEAILPFTHVSLTQFYGIEIDDFACDTATLSLWLAEHQMNNKFYDVLGTRPDALPLRPSGHIVCGNACRLDWNTVCPHTAEDEVYVMGNPPYLGSSMQDENQKKDLEMVCGHFSNYKNLDYIASWFYKGACYIENSNSKCAFVSTNSLCQGDSVALLWPNIFDKGIEIDFAYQSFKWNNNAKSNAAVIVVIIGLSNKSDRKKKLFSGSTYVKCDYINAYLLNAPNVIISRSNKSISNLPEMVFGNKPTDGGHLILEPDEKETIVSQYPEAAQYIRFYHGADTYINGGTRYCLWISDDQLSGAMSIPPIRERLEAVKRFRLESKASCTVLYADRPHLFKQRAHKDGVESLIVPGTSSERRRYVPIGFLNQDTIISNAAQAIYGANLLTFAIISNRMHTIWLQAIGGKLKTDYRYSSLVYNSFPFPKINALQKEELESLAQEILDIRDQHFDMTLGEMYNPETMPDDLREVHHRLDLVVERCYRLDPFTSDEERLEYLFKLYVKMTKK